MSLAITFHNAKNLPLKFAAARTRFDPVYPAIHELISRHSTETNGLTAFEYRVFSQNGEDGVIAEISGGSGAPTGSSLSLGSAKDGRAIPYSSPTYWIGEGYLPSQTQSLTHGSAQSICTIRE